MSMRERVILDLCGGTGSWSKPYRDAGYIVHNITWPNYDVRKVNFEPTKVTFIAGSNLVIPIAAIHGILAAPPCTEFSISKNSHSHRIRPKFLEALETVEACEKIIRFVQAEGWLKFWALENPRGHLRKFLGIPNFTFEQWQYGDMDVKPTDIWGYFKTPKPVVLERPAELHSDVFRAERKGVTRISALRTSTGMFGHDKSTIRAVTPPGFAQAFFKANR